VVKMDFNGIGFEGVNWIHVAPDRVNWGALMKMVISLWGSAKRGEFYLMSSDISDTSRKS
jgi:hypothetical protein